MQSESVRFLSVDEAVAIHERLIERFGGRPGVRDLGLLESSLYRPQTGYYKDIAERAAALFDSHLQNHAFVGGNKRAAFFVSDVFLRLNGWRLSVESNAAYDFIIGMLERGGSSYDKALPAIKRSLKKNRQ